MLNEGLSAIIFEDEITVYWNRVCSLSENEFFQVFCNGKYIGKTKKTHFEFFNLQPETEYLIKVVLKTDERVLFEVEKIFTTKVEPKIIDVTRSPYNAVGDGVVLDTLAIQKVVFAIDKSSFL